MQIRNKRFSHCINEKLDSVHQSGRPYNAILTDILFAIAEDETATARDRMAAIVIIKETVDGKPINTTVNAEVTGSPFESIPTDKIEALKAKLEEMCKPKEPVTDK